MASGRSWTSFGFTVRDGWRLWTSIALLLLLAAYFAYAVATLARSSEARASLRQQIGPLTAVMPHARTELYWFGGVSLTAGFCEEFLFRGYFIWALAPWLGWWGAAALSVLIFASGHAYQGWNGAVRTGIVGMLFTLVVAMSGSLWPAIVLHALLDLGQGMIAWLALREGQATGGPVEVEQQTEPQPASGVESTPVQAEAGAAPDPAA
jgi:membrane protease YdiL (CAAX protease family)